MPLCAVEGDPNSHGGGELIAENPQTVFINNIPVIDHAPDPAQADSYCPAPGHCNPETAEGSPNVFYYFNPVHRMEDERICGATTIVELQYNVYANNEGEPVEAALDPRFFSPPPRSTPPEPGKQPPSQIFTKPDSAPAGDPRPYEPPAKPPTREQNEQAGTAPNNPGPSEAPPVQDQPETKCEGDKPNVLGFLTKCLQESRQGVWRETGQGGAASNPNILNMWKNIGITWFNSDQVPWCAGFACFAMKQSGLKYIREAGAKNLANKLASGSVDPKYKEVPISDMKPGDLVLWGSGHVNFCYSANNGKYTFVGGNQAPGKAAEPPVRDPNNDGDVTVSWPTGWTPSRGGITKVVRLDC